MKNSIGALAGLSILVVEDDPELLHLTADWLELAGANTWRALNGKEAFDLYLKNSLVNIVLSDSKMPVADGRTLLKQIRTHATTGPYFFFLTGFTDFSEEEAKNMGADGVLFKPIGPRKIVELLQGLKIPRD